jgi:phenylpropionate dioxygenase-like ring-hydroxylating dioxygenase large terminal subunit
MDVAVDEDGATALAEPDPGTRLFGDPRRLVEGWYWALRSDEVGRGQARPVNLAGRALAIYRGADGAVRALDAHCAHMGAHLARGRVEGDGLRCHFHRWKYDGGGRCVEAPAVRGACPAAAVRAWPAAERYGLVWVWTGPVARAPLPVPPELDGRPVRARLGRRFAKRCHPHVVLVNAIDEHHFNSVHHLPVTLAMQARELSPARLQVCNTAPVSRATRLGRLIARFYAGPLTYSMVYSHGSAGTVTLGPDRLHCHLLFALRPTADGRTEGWTILLTRRRSGPGGAVLDRAILALTGLVARYFARGDTRVFDTIRFALKTPVSADRTVLAFVRHLERQPAVAWADEDRAAGPRAEDGRERP